MVSSTSMIAHWFAEVISLKIIHAVNFSVDGQQVTDDRCSLCADLQTGFDVTL